MFLNNVSSLATRTPRLHSNNENATLHRSKSLASDPNNLMAMKTPKSKDLGTQQRRRRALGDISNRKNGLSATNNNGKAGFSALKQQQSIVKPKVNFATPSSNQGHTNTKFATVLKPKTPAIHIDPIQESKTQVQEPVRDYDAVLGVTSRWSTDHEGEDRSPFDFIGREELFMVDSLRDEIAARQQQHARDEQIRMEVAYEEMAKGALDCWNDGLDDVMSHGMYDEGDILMQRVNSWEDAAESRLSDDSDLLGLLEDLDL
eukprot:CCRYP_016325-RA/>CCRYP_016325-RA protein AED:0.17 eAED:0.17 QI:0/-1/0/1/-1/1/1/0/259